MKDLSSMNPSFPIVSSPPDQRRSSPKISVILLAHNAGDSVRQAIESILSQTLADWELIVVDDGSTDTTRTAIQRYAAGDDRIKAVSQAHAGQVAARARGLALAQGDYIYCLDATYRSLPTTLRRLSDALEADPQAMIAYGATAPPRYRDTPGPQTDRDAGSLDALARLAAGDLFNAGAVAFRRATLTDDNLIGDASLLEDGTLWWLLASAGPVVFVMGGPLSEYRPPAELAYLIVAHHQPGHLARLIRALDQESSVFFIHIDQKTPIAPFKAAMPRQDNIVFLPDRVPVAWGQLSIVSATLKLLRTAINSGRTFTYYTLLSGSDYPIKDRAVIAARFQASDRQYIRIDRKLAGEPRNAHFRFVKRLPDGKYYGDLTPYHGSMYWSLTADCVHFILEFLDANPGYLDIHQHVFAPDEILFHSLLKHSPFAEAITHDFEQGTCTDNLHHGNHYIDWAGRHQREYLTLDERDFEDLLESEALFARKFDEVQSSKLLEMIDQQIHHVG